MGYYTDRNINVKHKNAEEIYQKLADFNDNTRYYMGGTENNDPLLEGKWYDFFKDLKAFTKLNPGILIETYNEGEDNDDIYKAWFKDGKAQIAQVRLTFDEYDESKME